MNFNEYQQQALSTAIYPLSRELDYTILGLTSETGELIEAHMSGLQENVLSELGDCFWYVAAVADAMKLPLEYIANFSEEKVYPKSQYLPIRIFEIAAESSKLAGVLKKAIRDNDGYMSDASTEKVKFSLYRLLWLMDSLCRWYGVSRASVMGKNLDKLSDRKRRGVLQGSGDNR